jgi:tellurite resistance protein TerC
VHAAAQVSWPFYAGFVGLVVVVLFIDLRLTQTEAHEPSLKEAGRTVAMWVGLAVAFGIVLALWRGHTSAGEYFAGYLIEYSLSVDNMFVFIVIFSFFQVQSTYQHRVLFFGILGAIVFRGAFIALGLGLINRFEWTIYLFGAFLVYTAVRIARGEEEVEPERNPVLRFAQRRLRTTAKYHGKRLFAVEDGRRVATPLFLVLLAIETMDILFAVDSIPAIFGVTRDPFIVLTSNVFAILGLRSLYFLVSRTMARFHLLKYGLAVILAFVGVKMLAAKIVSIPIWASLAVIVAVLAATAAASLVIPENGGQA